MDMQLKLQNRSDRLEPVLHDRSDWSARPVRQLHARDTAMEFSDHKNSLACRIGVHVLPMIQDA